MSGPAGDIDWDEATRRARRRDAAAVPGLAAFYAGIVLVTGGIGFTTGDAAWAAVGLMLAVFLVMSAAFRLVPRLRTKNAAGYRIQLALRRHLDPGPELRARTDRLARQVAGRAWVGWCAPIGPLTFILDGRWDRPVAAVAGTVLLVATTSAWMLWWRGQVLAARRWVADPPGPPRELPDPTTAEGRLTGRRELRLIVGISAAVVLVALLISAFI